MPTNFEKGTRTAILQGLGRCKLTNVSTTKPFVKGFTEASPENITISEEEEIVFKTAVKDLKNVAKEYIRGNEEIPDDSAFALDNISNPIAAINYISTNLPISTPEKMKLLEETTLRDRLFGLMRILNREIQYQHLQQDIRVNTFCISK